MMTPPAGLREQVSLLSMNSLRLPAIARYFVTVNQADALPFWLDWAQGEALPVLLLGGGSNLLLAGDFPGLVLRLNLLGRCWRDIAGDEASLELAAGENWHEAVLYAARNGWRGIENLALIPGTAGAAPVQNIGAYGVELADTLVGVEVFDRQQRCFTWLSREDCRLAYRDSLFKQKPQDYVVCKIRLRLSRTRPFSLDYAELRHWAATQAAGFHPGPLAVAQQVMLIRQKKLPDPQQLPNAGSFFKNPLVSVDQWQKLQQDFPQIVGYPQADGQVVKVAAGWLIEQAGWKGYRTDRVGVHARQSLVLVNHNGGTGAEVMALAHAIQADIARRFAVRLDMEPVLVATDGTC